MSNSVEAEESKKKATEMASEPSRCSSLIKVSNKERKRQEKREYRREFKKQKREIQKSQKKVAEPKQDPAINELNEKGETKGKEQRIAAKEERIIAFNKAMDQNFSVIIDCDWDSCHSESTMRSLGQQIMYCYSVNKKHTNPAEVYLTKIGPSLRSHLDILCFTNWIGVKSVDHDYIDFTQFSLEREEGKKQLVYLTSDAEETIQTLDSNCAYIIGGIVDRNRFKGVTYEKAKKQNVRTAKLPIKEYYAMKATPVLTVNHVFEILLNFAKFQSWPQALESVIPKRKTADNVADNGKNMDESEQEKTLEKEISNDRTKENSTAKIDKIKEEQNKE